MPAKSKAQLRWVNSPAGHRALGEKGVEEWNKATSGKRLPERVTSSKLKKRLNAREKSSAKLLRGMAGKSK